MADINSLLDTLFMTRKTPVQGLLSPEEQQGLETQKNIGTALGILTGVGTNYNKGVLESVLGGVTGAVGGRQAPIDYATRNFMTTTELSKMMQDIQKGQFETKKLQREEVGTLGLINKYPQFQNILLANPAEGVKAIAAANPEFNKDVNMFSKQTGKPIDTWTAKDFQDFNVYSQLPTSGDAAKIEADRAKITYDTGIKFGGPLLTKETYFTGQPQGTLQGAQQGTPAPTPAGKPSTGFKQPEKEVKAAIPLIESSAIAPKNKEQLLIEQPKATEATEYALNTTRNIRNAARRLLDNPNFKEAFGPDGVLKSYIPSTEAASAAAELDTLKNQLFLQGITEMRNASQTGAAVGNVTEKEGSRFENLKASLQQKKKFKDIVAELERLDQEMETTEKRVSNSYNRTYRPAEFIIEPLYNRGSYKAPTSAKDVPLNSPSGTKGNWGIREIR